MKVMEISEDNIQDFTSLLGKDLADDLNRVFYHGIGVKNDDDEAVGAFVYELVDSDNDKDTKSVIRFSKCDSVETENCIQKFYRDDAVYNEEIVESSYELSDEKEADLCEAVGFSKGKKESDYVQVKLADFAATDLGKKRNLPDYIVSIKDLSVLQYRTAIKDMLFREQKGLVSDLAFLPKNWFDMDISTCSLSDDNVDGLFLVRATPSGVLIPVLYYAYGPYYVKNLAFMLIKSIEKAMEKYTPDTPVVICRTKKSARDMMTKLMPQAKGDEVFFGNRKE